MIIPSFGGAKDVSEEDPIVFQLLDAEDSIFVEQGIKSCCFSSKGIDP